MKLMLSRPCLHSQPAQTVMLCSLDSDRMLLQCWMSERGRNWSCASLPTRVQQCMCRTCAMQEPHYFGVEQGSVVWC